MVINRKRHCRPRDGAANGQYPHRERHCNRRRRLPAPGDQRQNNSLFTIGNGNGPKSVTFTLAQPTTYSQLSFLAADGNGGTTMNMLLTYVGGGTAATTFSPGDWFGNTANTAIVANGRLSGTTYSNVNGGDPRLYYYDVSGLSTAAPLQSITFTTQSTSNTDTDILAISGFFGL